MATVRWIREGGCSTVVAKPLSRVSWKRFAGREEMDGWLVVRVPLPIRR